MIMQITKGTVTNISDPAKAGRIKVHLAELGGRETPDFIDPVITPGWHWLPLVNDVVQVIMPEDADDLVEFPEEMRWTGIIYDQEHPVASDFHTNYGKRRGFKTKAGHLFIVDDKIDLITLSLADGTAFELTDGLIKLNGANTELSDVNTDPVLLGDKVTTPFSTWTAAVSAAFATWGATIPPTPISNGAFITTLSGATSSLASSISTWASTKVTTG